ncbi:MAG: TetR/AcrR family transcriptional regulator [Rhodospirillales bacterium]|nr:TetR/AcrR family transcriptional regulator [Rhodospirillales bacterium]
MARPSKFNRQEAVEFVMNEFWRNGYEASSVKSLSEKLGITRSSFYNAFGSREALFKEALELYLNQSPDKVLALASPGEPIKELFVKTFRAACKARASDTEGRGCMVINGVTELCNVHDELGQVMENAVLGNLTRIEQLLEWGLAQGELGTGTDIHAKALALQNLLMGLNVLCKVVTQEGELWKAAETTLKGLDLFVEA